MLPAVADRPHGGPNAVALDGDWSLEILRHKRLGLICSIRCPGSIVIKTFDAIRQLRDAGIVFAGGFHSPMENECLDFLLRGEQPVIVCPAKGLGRPRCPARGERRSTPSGCSCFPHSATPSPAPPPPRPKPATNSSPRLCHAVLIPHASRGGKAEAIAQQILDQTQPLFTFPEDENSELLKLGPSTLRNRPDPTLYGW